MAEVTITVNEDKTLSIDNSFLGIQGEQLTVDIVVPSALYLLGHDLYVDFVLPTGEAYFKGGYDCSSGTVSIDFGASDSILDKDGDLYLQIVLGTTVSDVRTAYWKSIMTLAKVLPSINATSSAVLPYVPQMEFPETYPAANIELADVAEVITATNVEDALQEIAGNIDTVETNIGTLLYTENNYITDSEPLTTSVNKLDVALKDRADDIALKINLAGGASNPFTAMPYVGTAPIVESGSNANGSYVKYANGTMICGFNTSGTYSVGSVQGNIYYAAVSWTFPVEFYSTPSYANCNPFRSGYVVWSSGGGDPSTTSVSFYLTAGTSVPSGTVSLYFFAIGRWKA